MLSKLGVRYVIVGHSERREVFGESDELINAKVRAILVEEMTPILCVGETLEEREAEQAEAKVEAQIKAGLAKVSAEQVGSMVIAYEPIWGHRHRQDRFFRRRTSHVQTVRSVVRDTHGADAADAVRIQYGGSVKPINAAELMGQPDIDGALVGGASLEAESFARIIQYRLHDD